MPKAKKDNKNNTLQALDFFDQNGEQIYLRSIQSQVDQQSAPKEFQILMALDQSHQNNELNPDLVAKYESISVQGIRLLLIDDRSSRRS